MAITWNVKDFKCCWELGEGDTFIPHCITLDDDNWQWFKVYGEISYFEVEMEEQEDGEYKEICVKENELIFIKIEHEYTKKELLSMDSEEILEVIEENNWSDFII